MVGSVPDANSHMLDAKALNTPRYQSRKLDATLVIVEGFLSPTILNYIPPCSMA